MAWYCGEEVRYRGRLVYVSFRRDSYQGARVVKGKPLVFSRRDERKIKRILRRQGKTVDSHGEHGCGGPAE